MKRKVISLLLTLLFLVAFMPVSVQAANQDTNQATDQDNIIKVGWFPYPGGSEVHNGKYSGYNYDYLMEIAKYTGWQYEFVEEDFATCCEMLAKGEIDLIGGLAKTNERKAVFDYPDTSYGQTYSVLFTKQDSPLQPYDFENYNGIKIGILSTAATSDLVTQFAQSNGFSYEPFEYATSEEMGAALVSGEIDAATLASYIPTDGMRSLAKFAPIPIYIVTTKGNNDVLIGLNRALNYIKINKLYFDSELYQKYYASAENVELSEDEQEIVRASQKKPIQVGVIDNNAPISYWNEQSNSFEGLAVEIFDSICKKTGLNVEYVPMDNSGSKQTTSEGSLPELVLGVPTDEGIKNSQGWYLSGTLLDAPLAIAGKSGADISWDEKEGTIAIVKGFASAKAYIDEKLPDSNIDEYPTLEDCMSAVADSKADATVYFQSSIMYYMQKPYFSELKVVPANTTGTSLGAACTTEEAKPLLQIVDKGMGMVSDNELRELILNVTMLNTYPMKAEDILYKYRVPFIFIGILLVAVIAILIALYSIKRNSSEKLAIAFAQKNDALLEAQKASAAKGNFMSRMSHEIRTPLNAVIGYNTIARSEMTEAKTEEQRKQSEMKVMDCLSKSDIASRHLLTIINDVLDMSAIESGKIKIVNERFDFKGLISSLTAIFYSQAKSKGVGFDVQFDAEMEEWLVGDQMRVNQILTNLLSNAIKFTNDGGNVTLFIHPQTDTECIRLHFQVRDTGIGMSDEYMSRIWTPFEQADSSISRRFGGTGLGLSITKTLVDLLDGNITVKSKEGEGSTFFVDLTFARTAQPEQTGPYDFSTINALIVDDDVSTCDYVRLLLTRSGVRSSAVHSGMEAIEAVKAALNENDPYSICLIDWRMPKMDGLETVKRIRQIAGDALPIIVITAYDFSEVAEKAAEVGVNSFISKPLFQSSLFDLLANISGSPVPRNREKLSSYNFSGARVLLAEDNVMNMEIASRILESASLTVAQAWNGQEAVEMFLSEPAGTYKAILMDVQMPVIDGYQATKSIRSSQHPEAESIPIIAMTADAFAENVAESHSAGMNDHISKPIDLPTLFHTLSKYIK